MYARRTRPLITYRKSGVTYTGRKDIWVLSKGPVTNFSLLAPKDEPVFITRAGGDLPIMPPTICSGSAVIWNGRSSLRGKYGVLPHVFWNRMFWMFLRLPPILRHPSGQV
jgi:hypothetical protein